MVNLKRLIHPLSIVVLSLLLAAILVMIVGINTLAIAPAGEAISAVTPGDGFILRFDPTVTQFQVITLPTVAGQPRQPHSLAIIANSTNDEIWYTDLGADKIGRLIYTDTNDYTFTEIALPADSEPFDLVANDGYIWFTARGGNWIGRLEISTIQLFTFTVNTAPWSIDVGSDGSIWFSAKEANQLGQLIVTDTNDFAVISYPIPTANSQPHGLTVVLGPSEDRIWFTDTNPAQNRLALLNLALDKFITATTLPEPSYPVNLVNDGDDIWFTELLGNKISRFHIATLAFPVQYDVPTTHSQPYDLVVAANGDVWFSERTGGNLGKLANNADTPIEYALPAWLSPIWLQGIALGGQNKVWLAGFVPRQIYLPAIFKGQ